MSPFDFAGFYDMVWLGRHAYFAHHRQRFLHTWEAMQAQGLLAAPAAVLDVGGFGPMADALVQLGWQADCTTGDLRGPLHLPAASSDLVLCTEVIEHIKDVESARIEDLEAFNHSGVENMLRELARIMRPGAALLVTTPNAASWHTLAKWLHGEQPLFDPNHVREFTPHGLREVAARCGLAVTSLQVIDSWEAPDVSELAAYRALLRAYPRFAQVPRGDNIMAVLRHAAAA